MCTFYGCAFLPLLNDYELSDLNNIHIFKLNEVSLNTFNIYGRGRCYVFAAIHPHAQCKLVYSAKQFADINYNIPEAFLCERCQETLTWSPMGK